MGWFGFGGGKQSKVDKLVKKLTNAYVQTHERMFVMDKLSEIGTDEALFGLLQRFTYRTESPTTDSEEKEQAFRHLVHIGPTAIPAIQRFVAGHDAVHFPIKALSEIAGMDAAVELLLSVLDRSELKDARTNDQKVQIVSNMRDFEHPLVLAKLQELVSDESEEVRIMALDGLMTYGPETALEPAVQRLLDADEVPRVKMVLLEQLIDHAWSMSAWAEQLEEADALPYPYRLGAGGVCERAS